MREGGLCDHLPPRKFFFLLLKKKINKSNNNNKEEERKTWNIFNQTMPQQTRNWEIIWPISVYNITTHFRLVSGIDLVVTGIFSSH